tara:strand:+ start:12445 stop:13758 length:1314 start_codon:yes stop_codon:yes gene_type:complete
MVSAYGYNLYRKRYTGIYHKILELVRESRTWGHEQIEAHQSEQLYLMAKHCRHNIPYYQKLFSEYGLHENDFTSSKDLRRLPVLSKQTLRSNIDLFRQPGAKPFIIQHTSGSTGTPLALEVNEYTYKLAMALLVDHEELHGIPFGARRATFAGRMVQLSSDMTPPFARMNYAENQKLFSSYHLNSETFPWYQNHLEQFQPWEIIGYPSAICDLAMHYHRTGSESIFKPKAIITNSETLLHWQREAIESAFGSRVFDYYGTAEYVLFAGQRSKENYHLDFIIGITELLRDRLEDKAGRLIATSLTNYSMPLLRYDTGDTAMGSNVEEKSTVVRTLEQINGRVDDYIDTPDGRRIGRIDHIFKGLLGIKEAQVIQDQTGHCTLNIVPSDASQEVDTKSLQKRFSARVGLGMTMKIEFVTQIPRGSNRKFKGVIRKIPNS